MPACNCAQPLPPAPSPHAAGHHAEGQNPELSKYALFWQLVAFYCREKQELDRLPAEIDALSVTKASLEQQLAVLTQQGGDSYQQAAQIGLQLAKLAADIDAKTDRWLDLEEQAEQ